jgi:hypothetical protein
VPERDIVQQRRLAIVDATVVDEAVLTPQQQVAGPDRDVRRVAAAGEASANTAPPRVPRPAGRLPGASRKGGGWRIDQGTSPADRPLSAGEHRRRRTGRSGPTRAMPGSAAQTGWGGQWGRAVAGPGEKSREPVA